MLVRSKLNNGILHVYPILHNFAVCIDTVKPCPEIHMCVSVCVSK